MSTLTVENKKCLPLIKEYSKTYFLTAGECNPQAVMPVTLLASRFIEVATLHANDLDFGYYRLMETGDAWVLSRLTIEMKRWPVINDYYSVSTWVESVNRHFSERNFEVRDANGEILGYGRSVWMAINIKERSIASLAALDSLYAVVSEKECPIEKIKRFTPFDNDEQVKSSHYTFRYCDCDFNRHVNTVRYIELFLNQWPMEFFDRYLLKRLDIAFLKEEHFGEKVQVLLKEVEPNAFKGEIASVDGVSTRAVIKFEEYKIQHLHIN